MNGHILVFRGNLQNQGNIWALEIDNEIFIMGAGKDNPLIAKEPISIDYLKEKKDNIKGFFIINSSPKNSALLEEIYQELELSNVPIYGSEITKKGLKNFYSIEDSFLKNFISVDKNQDDVSVSKHVKASFIPIDSYYVGTLGIRIYNNEYCVYYLEDFTFSVLNSNNILFNSLFFMQKLKKFLSIRKKRTCLISGCQNLSLSNNGSLAFEFKKIFSKEKKTFLIFYDFDFLHIIETFEIAQKLNFNVNVADQTMFNFLSEVFEGNPFLKIMRDWKNQDKNGVYLLTVNFSEEMITKISKFIDKRKNQSFVYFLFPMSGAEGRTARLADYLHSFDNDFVDLSKSEGMSSGTNFYDLKFILRLLNPNIFVTLQNSYKNTTLIEEVKYFRPKIIPNNSYLNMTSSSKKISTSLIKTSKKLISTENLLLLQRQKLLKSGLLITFINALWKDEKLVLNNLKVFSLSVSETVDLSKLEKKINQWWESKISSETSHENFEQNAKQIIERRLSGLVKNYLSFENDVEIEEPLFLTFIANKKSKTLTENEK